MKKSSKRKKIAVKIRLPETLYREFTDAIPEGTRNAVVNMLVQAYLDGRVNLEGMK